MKTLYDLLGVRPNADDTTIKAAFRKAVKAYHPDANAGDRTAERRFMEITAAHAILRDRERRANYDRALERRRQKLLREWKITLVGWGLSAVMSAGVVSAGVMVVPQWLGKSNLVTSSFATRSPPPDRTGDDSTARPAVAATAMLAEGATKPNGELNPAPLTNRQTAEQGKDKQHDSAPSEETASKSADHGSEQPALAKASTPTAPADSGARPPAREPDRRSAMGGAAATKGVDRNRQTREVYVVARDDLAESLLRTHIFDPDEVEQILGFAEAAPDQPADEYAPEKFRHSVRHHHHRERRTAFRRSRFPRG
jgi:curved DNA-binding protein CbpA